MVGWLASCASVQLREYLIEERDGLDDHVVDLVHVELDLGAREGVAETKLRLVEVALLQTLDEALRGGSGKKAKERGEGAVSNDEHEGSGCRGVDALPNEARPAREP